MIFYFVDLYYLLSLFQCSDNCSTAADADKSLMALERVMSTLASQDSELGPSASAVPYKDSVSTST